MLGNPPPLPREHGAWAMLFVPLILGSLAARAVSSASLLILPATVLLFLARFAAIPGGTRIKRAAPGRLVWAGIYLAASALALALAVQLSPAPQRPAAWLLAAVTGLLGTANAGLVLTGRGRTLPAEGLAMASVAATAPLVMVLAGRPLNGPAVGVGAICLAYFLSTLALVRAFRSVKNGRGRWPAAAPCLLAHAVLGAALVALWRIEWLSGGLLLAFAPVLARTLWGLVRPAPHLRALGWREIAVTIVFLGAAGIAVF